MNGYCHIGSQRERVPTQMQVGRPGSEGGVGGARPSWTQLWFSPGPSQWCWYVKIDIVLSQHPRFKVCDICVNSSIMDEGAKMKTNPLQVEGQIIPIEYHKTSSGYVSLLLDSIHLKKVKSKLENSSLHLHLSNGWVLHRHNKSLVILHRFVHTH